LEKITFVDLTLFIFSLAFAPLLINKFQLFYYKFFNKIFFLHFYIIKKSLPQNEIIFLNNNVRFYRDLSVKEKRYFDHRVSSFLNNIQFFNRENIPITREMKLLVAATLTTLTFGFRKYKFNILNKIIIYPEQYRSSNSGNIHKGEFNPKLKTLVFSWNNFLLGFDCLKDNINLGIHEFSHVLHANSLLKKDINSIVFKKEYKALLNLIKNNEKLKSKIITSSYFRTYAFNNQYELLAVLFEHFIETPNELKANFPEIYKMIKKMLNFNFGNY
jgi:Mlc titration factor MtfA (ptsG expression regulator)